MPWPKSFYQTITSGVSTITKSWGDAIMQSINDVFNGDLSLTKLWVDGAGAQSATYAAGVIAKFTGGKATFTGSGTDPAISATGGNSGGTAVTGQGGASDGRGAVFIGGASNGVGLEAYGDGTGSGIDSTGGDSNGTGIVGRGGTGAGIGVRGEGSGGAVGISSALHITADDGNITASDGNVIAQGNGADEGNLKAQGSNGGDGYVSMAGTRSSATPGAGQSVALGTIYKDGAPIAWGKFTVSGAAINLARGYNMGTPTYSSSGDFVVNLQTGVTGGGTLCPVATVSGTTGLTINVTGGTTSVNVNIKDAAGTDTDADFNIVVFGGG